MTELLTDFSVFTGGDRSATLCLLAVTQAADGEGRAEFQAVVVAYRTDHLEALRAEGRDVEDEAGRLSVDEVRAHLGNVVLPRLAANGALDALPVPLVEGALLQLTPTLREALARDPDGLRTALRATGEHAATFEASGPIEGGSLLTAETLVKTYRKRNVVNGVSIE